MPSDIRSDDLGKGFYHYSDALLRTWPAGLIVADRNGSILALNPTAEKILGYTEALVMDRDMHSLLCSQAADYQHDVQECPVAKLIGNGEECDSLEAWWVTCSGSYVNVDVKKVLSNIEGRRATLISFQEIEGANVGEVASKRLALFAELNPAPILELNEECGIEFANPEMTSLMVEYGFNDDGRPVVLPEDISDIIQECIRNGKTITHRESNFEDRSMIWNLHPVLESKPIVVQVYGIDVTELSRTRELLNQAKDEAEKANESKSMFLANMSHEMRTPMNSVLGFSGLMKETVLTPTQLNYVDKINLSASSLLELINDILDFTKIEAGRLDLEIAQFDIREELEIVSDLFSDQIESKGLSLITCVDPNIPVALMGDSLRLKQIVINLISNAFKFASQGDIKVDVRLGALANDNVVLDISVQDSGIGIEKDAVERLFSAFSQADESTTRKYGGTGLGLSICKTLVEMMGGEISVKSQLGEGSLFYFSVTLQRSNAIRKNYSELDNVNFQGRQICYLETNVNKQKALVQNLAAYKIQVSCFTEDPVAQADQLSLLDAEAVLVGSGKENAKLFSIIKAGALISDSKPIILSKSMGAKNSDYDLDRVTDPVWIESPIKQSQVILALQKTVLNLAVEIETKQEPCSDIPASYEDVHMLVVDDNDFNQELMVDVLKNRGISADVAENGRVALQRMAEKSYDIVLMDIQMPVMGGHEAIKKIRCDSKLKDSVVIAMTANTIKGEMRKCLDDGMNGYITKPIDVERLFELINQYVVDDIQTKKTAGQTSAGEGDCLPLELPGMNIKKAVSLIGGRQTLFLRLAGMFFTNFANAPTDIKALLANRDHASAVRLAHTIRGSAGNLAANGLSESARLLESALKDKETDLDCLIDDFDQHLKVVMESIEQLNVQSG